MWYERGAALIQLQSRSPPQLPRHKDSIGSLLPVITAQFVCVVAYYDGSRVGITLVSWCSHDITLNSS